MALLVARSGLAPCSALLLLYDLIGD